MIKFLLFLILCAISLAVGFFIGGYVIWTALVEADTKVKHLIPVKWIEDWMYERNDLYSSNTTELVVEMLHDWEEENERT